MPVQESSFHRMIQNFWLMTNNHVVAGSDTLTVTFADGNSVEANIKGTDSEYDVAVVAVPLDSISEDTKKAISVATLGDSTELKVGEPAIAIGNALGMDSQLQQESSVL